MLDSLIKLNENRAQPSDLFSYMFQVEDKMEDLNLMVEELEDAY